MADTDVIGILSLLLAAGGAVYLFRSRILGPSTGAEAEEPPVESGRSATTLPPTLRPPESERPKATKKKSAAAASKPVSTKTTPAESPKAKESQKAPAAKAASPTATATATAKPKAARVIPEAKITIVDVPKDLPRIDVPRIEMEEDEDTEPTKVGRYERQSIRPPVERLVFDEGSDSDETPAAAQALVVHALAQTDPGKRRKQNEDSFLVRQEDGLFIVADGMGGHKGGEHASRLAVETIGKAFEEKTFEAEAHGNLPEAASELARAIQMANATILEEATKNPALKGMGTTLCAARFTADRRRLYLGHVGDSRCYRVRNGSMKQMTNDHTMADYGIAGPEGAHLSRALGVWPTVPIDIVMASPELGDVYLLCSDGLTKMLTNETIATQLLHEEDPKAAVERLVFFANAHGGKDNITVILIRVVRPGWKPPVRPTSPSSTTEG